MSSVCWCRAVPYNTSVSDSYQRSAEFCTLERLMTASLILLVKSIMGAIAICLQRMVFIATLSLSIANIKKCLRAVCLKPLTDPSVLMIINFYPGRFCSGRRVRGTVLLTTLLGSWFQTVPEPNTSPMRYWRPSCRFRFFLCFWAVGIKEDVDSCQIVQISMLRERPMLHPISRPLTSQETCYGTMLTCN